MVDPKYMRSGTYLKLSYSVSNIATFCKYLRNKISTAYFLFYLHVCAAISPGAVRVNGGNYLHSMETWLAIVEPYTGNLFQALLLTWLI